MSTNLDTGRSNLLDMPMHFSYENSPDQTTSADDQGWGAPASDTFIAFERWFMTECAT